MKLSVISKQVLTAALVLAASTSLAFAKNYKGENYKGEVECPAPAMLMGGFYLGAQVGYDVYDGKVTTPVSSAKMFVPGWLGGLFLGYGQYFTNWYLGGEIFGNWANANNSENNPSYYTKFQANSNYGLSILPGIKVNDTTLAYLRLGWNWANVKGRATNKTVVPNVSGSNTKTVNGFQWGLGMETLIVGNWSVRGEYNYTSFNSFHANTPTGVKFSPTDNQVLLGVVYHFA